VGNVVRGLFVEAFRVAGAEKLDGGRVVAEAEVDGLLGVGVEFVDAGGADLVHAGCVGLVDCLHGEVFAMKCQYQLVKMGDVCPKEWTQTYYALHSSA
jgi:hypothetical protein